LARKEEAFLPGPAVATARVRKLAVRGLGVRVRYELEKGIKTSGHLRSAAVLGCEFSPRLAARTELLRAAGRRRTRRRGLQRCRPAAVRALSEPRAGISN